MVFNVAICDDEIREIAHIRSLLEKYDMEYEVSFNIDEYKSGKDLAKTYITAGKYDILFLDVEMPGKSGLDIARSVRNIPDSTVKIVFISNYPEYMQDSFNVQAFNYLTKPIYYNAFCNLMTGLISQINEGRDNIIVINVDNSSVAIPIKDIISIKTSSANNGTLHYTTTNNDYFGKGLLSDEEKRLKAHSFVSPYRGILINLLHVHFVKQKELVLDNGDIIPISRRQEKNIRAIFSRGILTLYH